MTRTATGLRSRMVRASLPARRIHGRPSIGPRATSGVSRRQPSWWATSQRSAATIGPSATACRLAVRCRYPRPTFPSIRMRWVCGWAMAHVASRPSRPRTLSCCRRFEISATRRNSTAPRNGPTHTASGLPWLARRSQELLQPRREPHPGRSRQRWQYAPASAAEPTIPNPPASAWVSSDLSADGRRLRV